ncbi:MAG: PEGA domain-containing protein [bacterium]
MVLEVTRDGFEPWRQDIFLRAGEVTTVDVRLALTLSNESTLRFLVTPPDAEITLGGKRVHDGEARAPAGVAVDLLIERAGYRPHKEKLTPERGRQTLRYELALSPGTLFVETDPPGTVFVGDERRGRTPVRIDGLDPRTPWRVRVEAPGHQPHTETVQFGERRFVQVEAKLTPLAP